MRRKRDPVALRDQAAKKTLARIRSDRKRVGETLKPALEVIEERLFDRLLDVNAVWRGSGLPKKCSALFTAQVGQTPADYIARCRIEVAARLVAGTDLKFSRIADAVGFSPTSDTFLRTFKDQAGMTPTAFRLAAESADGPALEELWRRMEEAGMASAAGDFEEANRSLSQASVGLRDQRMANLSAQLGLLCHERGAHRTREGDVDRAYGDLAAARLGKRDAAIENAVAALSFFEVAGCRQDSLGAMRKLQTLLETEVIDVMAVVAEARTLARLNGGWLPDPRTTSDQRGQAGKPRLAQPI